MKTLLCFLLSLLPLSGVAITGISCTSNVVTVSCTACGIVQYQGFSITGASAYNFNGTAATASANSFTSPVAAGSSCSGSATGGTVLPAKQIINVSSFPAPNGSVTINYLSWYTTIIPVVCTSGTPPVPCTSAWSGASAAENAAIAAGTTVETAGSITFSATVPSATISTNLVAQYNAVQASYTTGFLGFSGYWWTGTAWVNH